MSLKSMAATGAAAVLVAGLGIAGAAPASAAVPLTCANIADGNLLAATSSAVLFRAEIGDAVSVRVTNNSISNTPIELYLGASLLVASGTAPTTLTYTFGTAATQDVDAILYFGRADFAWSCTHTDPARPIPDWVQAYGRFGSDAPCEDGWSPSWQKWAEPITGGWVCTRTIPSFG